MPSTGLARACEPPPERWPRTRVRARPSSLLRVRDEVSADEILQNPYVMIGTVEQMIADLQARRGRWGISYYVVHEDTTS